MRHTPVLDADAHGLEAALDGGTHGLDVASAVAEADFDLVGPRILYAGHHRNSGRSTGRKRYFHGDRKCRPLSKAPHAGQVAVGGQPESG